MRQSGAEALLFDLSTLPTLSAEAATAKAGEEAGSKLQTAVELGVPVLDWNAFQKLLNP